MIPTLAVPNLNMPPPLLVESFTGVPTHTSASERIPYHAVPSNPPVNAAYNNQQGTSSLPIAARIAQTTAASPSMQFLAPGAPAAPSFAFTSLFMTQVIGQGGVANDNGIFASFLSSMTPSSLTPTGDLLERFSLTKYQPSQAAKPLPQPQGAAQLAPQPQAVRPIRIETQQPQQQAPAQISMAGTAAPVSAPQPSAQYAASRSTPTERPAREQSGSNQIRFSDSLIRQRGVDAYIATFTRNLTNIDQQADETPVRVDL